MSMMSVDHSGWALDCKVYVGGLGSGADKEELEREFKEYGALKNVWVARNPPGFAFIEYRDARDAEDAVRGLDGILMNGRRIMVQMSTGKSKFSGSKSRSRSSSIDSDHSHNSDRQRRRQSRSDSFDAESSISRSRSRSRSSDSSIYRPPHRETRKSSRRKRRRSSHGRHHRGRSRRRRYTRSRSMSFDSESSASDSSSKYRSRSRSDSSVSILTVSSATSGHDSDRSTRQRRSSSPRNYRKKTRRSRKRNISVEISRPSSNVYSSCESETDTHPPVLSCLTCEPNKDSFIDLVGYSRHKSRSELSSETSNSRMDIDDKTVMNTDERQAKVPHGSADAAAQTDLYLLLHFIRNPDVLSETSLRLDRDDVLNNCNYPEIIPSIYQRRPAGNAANNVINHSNRQRYKPSNNSSVVD